RSWGICSFSGRIASVRPRFTIMFLRSKRCTIPETTSCLRSLNSLKICLRSASRICWMRFCLAACAAIRPIVAVSSLIRISSPTSASGSYFARASATSASAAAFATFSTTVFISNSSISPSSGLNRDSILRSGPNVRRAAECIISSTALITIVLSMPFSLETCSITRFRSTCIPPPRGADRAARQLFCCSTQTGARASICQLHLLVKIVFVIRARHLVETNRVALAARLIVKLDSTLADRHQPAHERLLPIARAMRSYLHPFTLDRLEMRQLAQRPVDSRRRDLQRVAALDRVVHVEQIAQRRAQLLQIAQGNSAARLVDQQPQQRISRALAKIHRNQFITLAFDVRLEQLDHLFRGRMKPQGRHLLSPLARDRRRSRLYVTKPKIRFAAPTKKWARAHFT